MSYTVAFWTKIIRSRGLFFSLVACSFSIFNFQFSIAQTQTQAASERRASVVFWNVENLYDTIPSPFYDDREWTPRGARQWDTARYCTKIANLARVLDDLAADVVGLAEVENKGVVRDLVRALGTDYNYIHLTSGDSRGIDLALLYKGDKFFPDEPAARLISSGTGREFLHVRGELLGEPIHLLVCHLASNLNRAKTRLRNMTALRSALEKILKTDPGANIITMGDMNATPGDKTIARTLGPVASPWDLVYSPHAGRERLRQGTYNYRGRWYMYDWMTTSPSISRGGGVLGIESAGIHTRDYLVETTTDGVRPRPTFGAGEYRAGFSDHLPVWMVVVK
jgi:endonuclease/exonuclease/phosphatase family metal-dependent hydrolase